MIADERMHPPPRLQRLRRERHEELHHLARIMATVGDVARPHQVGAPAAPALLSVDDARLPEDGDQAVVVAVHVAHFHDARTAGEDVLRRDAAFGHEEGEEQGDPGR